MSKCGLPYAKHFATAVCAIAVAAMTALACLSGCASNQQAIAVKDSVEAYSWEELSDISTEIAEAPDDAAAWNIAKSYNLVGEDGRLDGTQAKSIELSDGTQIDAAIADINHDERAEGGTAGITFITTKAVALRGMNNNAGFEDAGGSRYMDAIGGWEASDIRSWLNDDFMRQLPDDLQASLVEVEKASCVVPQIETLIDDQDMLMSSPASLIGKSVDKLWIPALVEVSGVQSDTAAASEFSAWTPVLQAEGKQYRVFSDANVKEESANDALAMELATDTWNEPATETSGSNSSKGCRWWLRSLEEWTFANVLENGSIDRRDDVVVGGNPQGIVVCFAL